MRRRGAAGRPDDETGPGRPQLSKTVFTAFARLRDPDLASWVERETRFPDSMVDRITPATTDTDRAEIRDRFGIDDQWPVVCEPFTQWVLQDIFAAGRPPYEQAGVQVVGDVEPHELMKLWLLNGSHREPTSKASRSKWSAGSCRRPGASARIPWRSSPTRTCSGT